MGFAVAEGQRQKFTSKERDNETGLDYFGARYYASVQGRFTGVDPQNYQAMLDPSDPQSWNGYSYVNNNPLERVDPDGKNFWHKLKNAFWYGYFVEDDEIARLEQERREWLSHNYYEQDSEGNWRPFDASKLSRQDVFDKYREVQAQYENGRLHELSVDEAIQAWANVSGSSSSSGPTKGPSGKVSTEKYLEKNWDKATFGSIKKSIAYHVGKHSKLSAVEYTQRALKAFADASATKTPTTDMLGREAIKVVSKEGSGLFTKAGKIIWFHPN